MNASKNSAMRALMPYSISCLGAMTMFLGLVCSFATPAGAQTEVSMSMAGPGGTAHSLARFSGGIVTVEFDTHLRTVLDDPVDESETTSGKLSDLDLDNVMFGFDSTRYDRPYANLNCKPANGNCVQQSDGSPNGIDITIWCDSQAECQQFIQALRQTQAPPPPVQNTPVQTRPAAPAPVQPQAVVQPPAPPAASQSQIAALRDLIATISWLNGRQGANNNALDKLLKQIEADKPPPPPPPAKSVYAAFAQAGGFDANGTWGAATASDLNTAIGTANGNCSKGANTSCDDEGYCLLRSGLWAAWASDRMVVGNSAFTCNVKTQDEAIAQAEAWCGDGCKVLWSGSGQ